MSPVRVAPVLDRASFDEASGMLNDLAGQVREVIGTWIDAGLRVADVDVRTGASLNDERDPNDVPARLLVPFSVTVVCEATFGEMDQCTSWVPASWDRTGYPRSRNCRPHILVHSPDWVVIKAEARHQPHWQQDQLLELCEPHWARGRPIGEAD
jgi:hypothetical protein